MSPALKWVLAALSVSLMVNVFVAGHYVGAGMGDRPDQGPPPVLASSIIPQDVHRALPPEARQAFRGEMKGKWADIRAARQSLKQAKGKIPALVRAPELDAQALSDVFAEMRSATGTLQESFEGAFVSALSAMSEAERAVLTQRLLERARARRTRLRDRRSERQDGPPPR